MELNKMNVPERSKDKESHPNVEGQTEAQNIL